MIRRERVDDQRFGLQRNPKERDGINQERCSETRQAGGWGGSGRPRAAQLPINHAASAIFICTAEEGMAWRRANLKGGARALHMDHDDFILPHFTCLFERLGRRHIVHNFCHLHKEIFIWTSICKTSRAGGNSAQLRRSLLGSCMSLVCFGWSASCISLVYKYSSHYLRSYIYRWHTL